MSGNRLISVLMGLVVFGLVGLLRGLCSAGRLLELGCDGGPGCPVRVAGSWAQLVILHLLFRQGLAYHSDMILIKGANSNVSGFSLSIPLLTAIKRTLFRLNISIALPTWR